MTERLMIQRAVPLLDLDVARDGRTVTAYTATFDDPYEAPADNGRGRIIESIARTAFNNYLSRYGVSRVIPLYNHGLSIYGEPSERDGDPLGRPLEIKPDGRGLLTRTEFGTTPRQQEVLQMLKDGTITTYSFQGPVYRSVTAPGRTSGDLPHVMRVELGLRDYGPGVFTVNKNASLVAIRSVSLIAEEFAQLSDEEREELLKQISPPQAPTGDLDNENNDPPQATSDLDKSLTIIEQLEREAAQRRRREP